MSFRIKTTSITLLNLLFHQPYTNTPATATPKSHLEVPTARPSHSGPSCTCTPSTSELQCDSLPSAQRNTPRRPCPSPGFEKPHFITHTHTHTSRSETQPPWHPQAHASSSRHSCSSLPFSSSCHPASRVLSSHQDSPHLSTATPIQAHSLSSTMCYRDRTQAMLLPRSLSRLVSILQTMSSAFHRTRVMS